MGGWLDFLHPRDAGGRFTTSDTGSEGGVALPAPGSKYAEKEGAKQAKKDAAAQKKAEAEAKREQKKQEAAAKKAAAEKKREEKKAEVEAKKQARAAEVANKKAVAEAKRQDKRANASSSKGSKSASQHKEASKAAAPTPIVIQVQGSVSKVSASPASQVDTSTTSMAIKNPPKVAGVSPHPAVKGSARKKAMGRA